jgi:hypothetical protein
MIGMRWRASVLATVVGSLAFAATGRAADQLVLGEAFVLVNRGGPELRTAVATADERNAPATIVGDPTLAGSAGGAILTLIANGDSPSSQDFVLPQGTTSSGKPFWRVMGGGFRYDDVDGEQGPVTAVRIKRTSGGRFTIESAVLGQNGPVEVVPPNPGTDAFMTLKLGLAPEAGDRYCVQYGPESDIRNDGPFFFSATNPVEKGLPPASHDDHHDDDHEQHDRRELPDVLAQRERLVHRDALHQRHGLPGGAEPVLPAGSLPGRVPVIAHASRGQLRRGNPLSSPPDERPRARPRAPRRRRGSRGDRRAPSGPVPHPARPRRAGRRAGQRAGRGEHRKASLTALSS